MSILRLVMIYLVFGSHGLIGLIELGLALIHHHEGHIEAMFCYVGIASAHLLIFAGHAARDVFGKPPAK